MKPSVDESNNSQSKINDLVQYVQLNLNGLELLNNKNYKDALETFGKCIEIAKDLDDIKHVDSLINYSICQFFSGNFEEAYNFLEKSKEISNRLYENSNNDMQIKNIHLRVLSNLSLTSLSLNKISESKDYFTSCKEIINSTESSDEKMDLLKNLLNIFFRLDSLIKFHEAGKNCFEASSNNNSERIFNLEIQNKMINKCLYALHKSLKENNFEYWHNCLTDELNKSKKSKDKDQSFYVFLVINQMASGYNNKGVNNENLPTTLSNLVKYYQEQFSKDLKFKEKNINKLLSDYKERVDLSVEIYKDLWDLENNLNSKLNQQPNENQLPSDGNNSDKAKNNKILVKILLKHSINFLNKEENQNDEIKKQLETSLKLLDNDELDCSMINFKNMNNEIIKSINVLLNNLCIIIKKNIMIYNLKKLKYLTLNYYSMDELMQEKYVAVDEYLNNKLLGLYKGDKMVKFNYSSKGIKEHYYQIQIEGGVYKLLTYKDEEKFNDKNVSKRFELTALENITVGCESLKLKKRLVNKELINYSPWKFLSLYFPQRTIDLYIENEDRLKDWFLGLYYYMNKIEKKEKVPKINYFFLNKMKLRLLYELVNKEGDLEILEQIRTFSSENELEFQTISIQKTILLYTKIIEKLGEQK